MAGAALLALVAGAGCAPKPPPRFHGRPGEGLHGRPPGGTSGARGFFISPMGEPFRGAGASEAVRLWFDGADGNHDGRIVLAEFQADAARFFARLDTSGDGEIDPAEIEQYETVVAPQVAAGGMGAGGDGSGRDGGFGAGRRGGGMHGGGMGGSGGGGGMGGGRRMGGGEGPAGSAGSPASGEGRQGAGRFSFLAIPEPVTSADADFNRGISRAEFARAAGQRFLLLDSAHQGYLSFDKLPPLPQRGGWRGGGGRRSSGGKGAAPDE